MSEHVEIHVTCGSAAEADAIATALVEQRFAACVQQVPIRSTFRWRGRVERDEEVLLLVRTRRARYTDVEATVLAMHSYEMPAITCIAVVAGSSEYLSWIDVESR